MRNYVSLPRKPIEGLWKLLESHRGIYFGSLLALAVTVGAETGGYLLLRTFVDEAIANSTWIVPLSVIALGYFGLSLIRGGFSFLSGKFTAFASENVIRDIRNAIYDHMQRLSFSYHDGIKTGDLIQRSTSDVDTLRRFYSEMVHGMARILFLFAINFTTIMILEWRLALITIVLIPVMMFVSVKFFGRIHNAYEAYQDQDGTLSAVLQENLTGVRIVRAFARQDFEKEKFNEANAKKRRLGYKFMMSHATFWPISELLGGAQSVIGIVAGGLMAMNGHITLGTYVAYIGLAKGIIWPLQQLGRLIARLSTVSVSYERVGVVLREEQEDLESGNAPDVREVSGAIKFESVSFSYNSGAPVLHDIDFSCSPGEHIALLGEPGSGKTTLVNLIPRFYSYSDGRIVLDGRELNEYSRHYLRKHIGIVEQEPFLFSTDIRSNISFGVEREVEHDEIERVAKVAAIHDSIASFPEGYDTLVGERGVTLSGGQKQRIAIARTLLKDPAILILDDSTSAVDAETEVSIREALKTLMKGRTTFIIAHRVQSLMQADQILVFKEGRIIQRGTHESLIDTPGFYNEVFQLQTRIELELEEQLHHG
jgi:ATP-binding cassette, subfamily B, bacterial